MLRLSLAPANFFRNYPATIGELLLQPYRNNRSSPHSYLHLKTNSELQSSPGVYSESDDLQNPEEALSIFPNLTPEKFVSQLLTQKSEQDPTGLNEFSQQSPLDLTVSYSVSANSTKPNNTTKSENSGVQIQGVSYRNVVRSYQRNSIVQSRLQNRDEQLNLFFRQSERYTSEIKSVQVEEFQDVRNKVAAAFEYNIHLEFDFLQQFYSQSKQINGVGSDVLQGYLNVTDQTLQRSVDVTKSFFNTVDSLLSGSKKQFLERINQLFNEMRTALGENSDTVEQDREQIINTVTAFFDKTEALLDQAEAKALNSAHETPQVNFSNPQQTDLSLDQSVQTPVENISE